MRKIRRARSRRRAEYTKLLRDLLREKLRTGTVFGPRDKRKRNFCSLDITPVLAPPPYEIR